MAKRRRRAIRDRPGPSGFLVVDKPAGLTSHDIVDAARGWLGLRQIGHLGTLDPQATGVLPLAVRSATKLAPFFTDGVKRYVGTVRLGIETDTLDGEGEVVSRYEGELPGREDVRRALESFVGDIEQIPPMYSAVKKDGVPLHRLARRGEEVEREPKKVHIERLELVRFAHAEAEIAVECGGGTYVRTLAADLGARLGCGAYLASLRRLQSGPFEIDQALAPERCRQAAEARELETMLIPPQSALAFPIVELTAQAVARVRNGADISPGTLERGPRGTRVSAVDPKGAMVAVLELRVDRRLWPLRVLPSEGG